MLRLMIALLALLLAVWIFVPARGGDGGGLPPGMTREDCDEGRSEDPLDLRICAALGPLRLAMIWAAQPGAAAYRVSGDIHYYDHSCTGLGLRSKGTPAFSEVLPGSRTWFAFPAPDDDANFVSQFSFQIEALGENSEVLASDGRAIRAEPGPCMEQRSGARPVSRGRPAASPAWSAGA